MKDKKAIKREILDKFRSMNAENQETLPLHWLELVYLKKLNSNENLKRLLEQKTENTEQQIIQPIQQEQPKSKKNCFRIFGSFAK